MSIDDLFRDLARTLARVPDKTAEELRELHEDFIRACRWVDGNPAEQQRIDDIADLLDAEETLYAQAVAANERGDTGTAVPLLRQCAEADIGEAAWLLAQLLEDTGNTPEAMTWYQRARVEGEPRADAKLADRDHRLAAAIEPAQFVCGPNINTRERLRLANAQSRFTERGAICSNSPICSTERPPK